MNSKDCVKEIMKFRGWTQSKLAEESGVGTQSRVTGFINRSESMRVDNLLTLIEAMGCELVIRDKMGSKQEWRVTDK